MFVQLLGNKIISTLGLIALAQLLGEDVWGTVALVLGFVAFAQVLNDTGVRDILIQRQRRFRLWIGPAFWLATSAGLCASVFIVAAAPLVASLAYDDPSLTPLMWSLAAVPLLDSVAGIAQAKIQIDLRFRAMALIGAVGASGQMAVAVLLAWWGFGPWAWIIARLLMSIVTCLWSWKLAGIKVPRRAYVRRWRYLLGSSARLVATGVLMLLAFQAGPIVLGVLHDKQAVGRFYFAYNLSISLLIPVTASVSQVLLPSISKLQDDLQRFRAAYVRSASAFAFIVIPLTLLAAATAEPFIQLLFGERWEPAVLTMQLLSLAIAFKCGESTAMSTLKAMGKFDRVLSFYMMNAIVTYVGVVVGALLGEATMTAAGLAVAWAVVGPLATMMALTTVGLPKRTYADITVPPLIMGLASMGTAMVLVMPMFDSIDRAAFGKLSYALMLVLQMALIALLGLPAYLLGMWFARRDVVLEAAGPFLRRWRSRRAATVGGSPG
jgi:O-antigen/teichoic acid export membrane protein